jgi:hypothetical protein
MTIFKMVFVKQRGNNAYHVFATVPGFNCELPHEYGANDPYCQPWEVNEDLFDCMRVYYEQEGKGDNVKLCEQGGECGSDDK